MEAVLSSSSNQRRNSASVARSLPTVEKFCRSLLRKKASRFASSSSLQGISLKVFLSTDGRLRPGLRFAIAVIVFVLTDALAAAFTLPLTHYFPNPLLFEMFFRPFHLILMLAIFGLMLRYVDRTSEEPLSAQGLSVAGPWLKELELGLLLGFGFVSLAVVIIAIRGSYHLTRILGSGAGPCLIVIWVLLTAAMLEEVAFRGYPFQRLVESIGPVAATTLLSLGFGAIHLGNPHATKIGAVNTVLVGVLFSLAYFKTRRLWLPFGIHFAWNATMGLIFGLPVSGLTMFSVVLRGQANGPYWLTGGDYGIEASLTGTFVTLCGIILLAFVRRKKNVVHSAFPAE